MAPADGPGAPPGWTDSHCHLQHLTELGARRAVLERAGAAGVTTMVCVGTDAQSSRAAIEIATEESGRGVYATAGLHPHDASEGTEALARLLEEEAASPSSRLVAVVECGLDYHYDNSPRGVQREAFAAQVRLAHSYGLTLVIHTREAFEDTFAILRTEGAPARTVFHCFTGGPAEAERCLETGAYLSFSGIVTFKNAEEVRQAARLCPPDRVLIETDSPYLAPVPYRGRENEPCYVVRVGEQLAAEKEMAVAELAGLTAGNAASAFGLG